MPKKINIIVSQTFLTHADVFITEKELEMLKREWCEEQDIIQARIIASANEVPDNESAHEWIKAMVTLDDELIFDI